MRRPPGRVTESRAAPGGPSLYIHVGSNHRKEDPAIYAFYIEVKLDQEVRLERDLRIAAIRTATWSTSGEIGTLGSAYLQQARDRIKDQVDQFINAYLSVNPK